MQSFNWEDFEGSLNYLRDTHNEILIKLETHSYDFNQENLLNITNLERNMSVNIINKNINEAIQEILSKGYQLIHLGKSDINYIL